jgi:glucokinase
MKIRTYQPSDLETLKQIHADRGLPPACMPEPENPLFIVKKVIEEAGQVQAATFVKLTSEPWLLLDPDLPDKKAVQLVRIISDITSVAAANLGLEEMTCWIPPEAGPSFGKLLESIGYIKTPWQSYTIVLRK